MSNIETDAKNAASHGRISLRQKMAAHPFLVAYVALGVGFILGLIVRSAL